LNFTSPGPVALQASNQASKASPWAPKKEKDQKKKQSKMRTQHPTQSPSINATKTGQFLRICSSPAQECEGG
jgi:hypothetical protein